jgi:hypothetical protein
MRLTRPALALLASLGLAATACMGSDSKPARPPQAIVADARAALSHASSARFDIELRLRVEGRLEGPAQQLAGGPITVRLQGVASGGAARRSAADIRFRIEASGVSFEGRILRAGGDRTYVQIPAFLGPGWYYTTGSGTSSPLDGLGDPGRWLTHRSSERDGDVERVSGEVNPRALAEALSSATPDTASVRALAKGIRVSRATAGFDADTHLPVDMQARLAVDVPSTLEGPLSGLRSLDLRVEGTFSDWNAPVSVTAPRGAHPLDTQNLPGGLGAVA